MRIIVIFVFVRLFHVLTLCVFYAFYAYKKHASKSRLLRFSCFLCFLCILSFLFFFCLWNYPGVLTFCACENIYYTTHYILHTHFIPSMYFVLFCAHIKRFQSSQYFFIIAIFLSIIIIVIITIIIIVIIIITMLFNYYYFYENKQAYEFHCLVRVFYHRNMIMMFCQFHRFLFYAF